MKEVYAFKLVKPRGWDTGLNASKRLGARNACDH
jgi:hypothetical protein